MKKSIAKRVGVLVVCACSMFIMMLFTACAGVNPGISNTGTNGSSGTNPATSTGSTQSPQGTTTGSTPQNQNNSSTNQPGSISFIGTIQSSDATSVTVSMPNGDTLPVTFNAATDRRDFPQFTNGQLIDVNASTLTDGVFVAKDLKAVDQKDAQDPQKRSEIDFKAIVTSPVGADNVIHFQVGNKSYSVTANGGTQLKGGFTSVQSIQPNQAVKLNIQYNGTNSTLLKVDNGNS
jgi:Domain of unknown function (DUF5666)